MGDLGKMLVAALIVAAVLAAIFLGVGLLPEIHDVIPRVRPA